MIFKHIFISLLVLSILIPTYLTLDNPALLPVTLGIWIVNVVGFLLFLNVVLTYLSYRERRPRIIRFRRGYRIAAVVTAFNEDPEIVEETLESVKVAVEEYGYGDVYLLDDSRDPELAGEYDKICIRLGVRHVRRDSNRGFKAGNLNNFLRRYGFKYDLMAVFDADQRPTKDFFTQLIPYFDDDVGYVYTPQAYSILDSAVAVGAASQQKPFYYLILPGFTDHSRFSIGSGVIYRVDVLMKVGGFEEGNVCEDVATSIKINELGYRGVYVDAPLVYYGIPPRDVLSYVRQQGRWSLGFFQLLGDILGRRLDLKSFIHYLSGYLYWLRVGLLRNIEALTPIIFVLTGESFIKMDPLTYIATYIPYFFSSIAIFILISRWVVGYGLKDFIYHQGVENLAFWEVTKSFFKSIFHRRHVFTVTSKRKVDRGIKGLAPHFILITLLFIGLEVGMYRILFTPLGQEMLYAYIVNVFWIAYLLMFQVSGILLVGRDYEPRFVIPALTRVGTSLEAG